MVDFFDRFPEEKQSAGDEHGVPPGKRKAGHDRLGQVNQPESPRNKNQPSHQGNEQTNDPRAVPLVVRQPRHHDGNDQHVIDAQDKLQPDEQEQGRQGRQREGIRKQRGKIH